jgi:Tol biopolymer transport system component
MNKKTLIISLIIVCLFLTMVLPMAAAPKPGGGGGKPPKDEPPADPVITYSAGENLERLMVMNADGAQLTRIYRTRGQIHAPTWSPDGTSIAFQKGGYPYGQLWALDVAVVDGKPKGSNARLLLDDCYPCSPAWSPSGSTIAIASEMITGGYGTEIQTVPATGGTPTTLYTAATGYAVGGPTWNSDGSELAFRLGEISTSTWSIVIFDVATKTITDTLLEGEFYPGGLDWARTQDVIAFVASGKVYTVDIATDTATEVVGANGWSPSPSWSPDDSQIVFQGPNSDGRKIKSIDMSTGVVTTLTSKEGWYPDWCRS